MAAWAAFSLPLVLVNGSYILMVLSDPFGWGWDLLGASYIDWTPLVPHWTPYVQVPLLLTGLAYALKTGYGHGEKLFGRAGQAIRAFAPVAVCSPHSPSYSWSSIWGSDMKNEKFTESVAVCLSLAGILGAAFLPFRHESNSLAEGIPFDAQVIALTAAAEAALDSTAASGISMKDESGSTALEPGDPVADILLVDHEGREFRLSDLEGRVVVLSFFYTHRRLPSMCPATASRPPRDSSSTTWPLR